MKQSVVRSRALQHALRAIHYQVFYDGHMKGEHPGCSECGIGWPCRTIRILDAAEGANLEWIP